jgi:hypothetical protein
VRVSVQAMWDLPSARIVRIGAYADAVDTSG